ncbi:MAG: hypothetical protein JJV98_10825 [Desulfosarcina sp.]|nr:hypothetical protein [Desulfobacterales bacterium]
MVERIRQTGSVGAVFTPARPRTVKRDRRRGDQRNQQDEHENIGRDEEGLEENTSPSLETTSKPGRKPDEKPPTTGGRINVVI